MERKKIEILDQIIKENPKDEFPHESLFGFFHQQQNPTFFTDASIFDKTEYLDIKKKFMEKKEFSTIEKLSMGSMLGMAIGDAMGAPVEFQPLSYTYDTIKDMGEKPRGNFDLKPGQWTDDTSMGLCLADSLIEKKGEFKARDIMMRFLYGGFMGIIMHLDLIIKVDILLVQEEIFLEVLGLILELMVKMNIQFMEIKKLLVMDQ